jgi:hypothetical protein
LQSQLDDNHHINTEKLERGFMSSSTLKIKDVIDPASLPPQCDFILPKYNTVLYANGCFFKNDFDIWQETIGFSSIQFHLDCYDKTSSEEFTLPSTWARDFITCKTSEKAYVLNNEIQIYINNADIVKYNSNMSSSQVENTEYLFDFDEKIFRHEATKNISAGGNIFHCVNARGKGYAIAGEGALTSQMNICVNTKNFNQMYCDGTKTGSMSRNKYDKCPANVSNTPLIINRAFNKKITIRKRNRFSHCS